MIALAVIIILIIAIALLRVGGRAVFSDGSISAWLSVGFLSIKLFPRKPKLKIKAKRAEKPTKEKKKKAKPAKKPT